MDIRRHETREGDERPLSSLMKADEVMSIDRNIEIPILFVKMKNQTSFSLFFFLWNCNRRNGCSLVSLPSSPL